MKLRSIMTDRVIRIDPEEPVSVAARTLAKYNLGALPVCGGNGRLCGMVTDRDIVIRCLAAGRQPGNTRVQDVMSRQVITGSPDMEAEEAARIMGKHQIRRLPMVENGRLCGMVSLADLVRQRENGPKTVQILKEITGNLSQRD